MDADRARHPAIAPPDVLVHVSWLPTRAEAARARPGRQIGTTLVDTRRPRARVLKRPYVLFSPRSGVSSRGHAPDPTVWKNQETPTSGPDTPRKRGSRVPGRARASAAGRGGVTRTLGRVSIRGARPRVAYFARKTATRAAVGAESAKKKEKPFSNGISKSSHK